MEQWNAPKGGFTSGFRYSAALPKQEESLKEFKVVFGPDHPNTLNAMFNLGNAYMAVGRLQDGLLLLEETLKLRKAKLGPDHPVTLGSMNMLAAMYWHAGRLQEALSLHEERLKLIR